MSARAKLFIITLCVLSGSSCFSEARLVCELGSFSNGSSECLSCHSSCASCSGPSAEECTSCGVGRVLNPDGTCLCVAGTSGSDGQCQACSTCAKGEYEEEACTSSADTECGSCYSKCAECSGPNDNECTACEPGRFINSEGKCEDCGSDCQSGQYPATACGGSTDLQCGNCHKECLECTGPNDNDCTACPLESSSFVNGNGECEPCHDSCAACTGASDEDCTACVAGRFHHANGKCLAFIDSGQSLGSSTSRDVALADLDGDGDIDAFAANWSGADKVWLNDGAGIFTDAGQSLESPFSTSVALADLNGDTHIDAFVAAGYTGSNKVWLNDGAGNFTDSGQSFGNSSSESVALADLDGDTDIDAFVANGTGAAYTVWLNDGEGQFTDSGQSFGSLYSYGVGLADLDGVNGIDAFAVHGPPGASTANKVWLNNGNGEGKFTGSGQSLGSFYSWGVALGDLNGDMRADAFVVNGGASEFNTVWLNDGAGMFTDAGLSFGDFHRGRSVALADLDGDGDLDAFVAKIGVAPSFVDTNTVWFLQ